jgi:hypothetical protein
MRGSEVSVSVVKCSWVKREVLQCSDGLSNKVSNIIRRQYEVAAYIYFAIITFFHILQALFFINVYTIVFLFNAVIYVFLLLCLYILIVCLCIFIVPADIFRLP